MSYIWRNFHWLNKVHVHVFSLLWHVSTDPIYTWPPTDPVWNALRPSRHYPHTPRVLPSTHSHPSTTSKSRTVDDCSQLGFYNERRKVVCQRPAIWKKIHKTFMTELACSQNYCLLWYHQLFHSGQIHVLPDNIDEGHYLMCFPQNSCISAMCTNSSKFRIVCLRIRVLSINSSCVMHL